MACTISTILADLALHQPVVIPHLNRRSATTHPARPPPTDFDVELVVLLGRHDPKPAYAARHARTGTITMVVSRTAWAAYKAAQRGDQGGMSAERNLLADVLTKQITPCLRL